MKIIQPGHIYELDNFDGSTPKQVIGFIEKAPLTAGGPLETVHDGTTNEEVLAMLIDRMNFLQRLLPCIENVHILALLKEAAVIIDQRTADRTARAVKGTNSV